MEYQKWLCEWLETFIKPMMKKRTYIKYRWMVESSIKPNLGQYEIDDLNNIVLQKYVSSLVNKYSANTISNMISILKSSLKLATKYNITKQKFNDDLDKPKIEEKKVECFSREEQKKIENYILNKNNNKLIGILICLYTGIRIGELFALTWDDIDFKNEIMNITKSCHDEWGENGYIKEVELPKTSMSKRIIPLPKQIMPYLKKSKKKSTSNYVIYGKSKFISIRSYQRTFSLILKKLKIEHKCFHALRHTFATRALECGMDVKTLSEILGHKNSMITLNRYVHSLIEHKSKMMNKVGKLLEETKN